MDGFNHQQQNMQYYYPVKKKNNFATAALIVGFCSLFLLITFILPLPLGALGILFVILSKRKGEKLAGTAIAGLITSVMGMLLGLALTVSVGVATFQMLKPENRDLLNRQFESIYGIDFDEYMDRLYGDDLDL